MEEIGQQLQEVLGRHDVTVSYFEMAEIESVQ